MMGDTYNVLVTGGCGYLGSQLIRDLSNHDELSVSLVRILDNLQGGTHEALMDLPSDGNYQFIEGDILNPSVLETVLDDINVVVHLAAVVRTPLSFDEPTWVEQVNHWGTSHLLEACLEAGVDQFVYVSSTAVFGPGGPFTEDDECSPAGAYAHSKLEAENAVLSARRRGLNATIFRLGTMYGPAPVTRFDAVVNKFAYLAGVEQALTIYGSGEQVRPFIDVRDAAGLVCWYLTRSETDSDRLLNAVTENSSVLDLVDIVKEVKPDISVRYTEQDVRTHFSFEVSSNRLRDLGWKPDYSIRHGLSELTRRFQGFGALELSH